MSRSPEKTTGHEECPVAPLPAEITQPAEMLPGQPERRKVVFRTLRKSLRRGMKKSRP